jgi:HlyD family secretion protein
MKRIKIILMAVFVSILLEVGASVIERNNYNPGTTVAVIAEMNRFRFRTLIAEHYLRHVSLGEM